jgi:RNA recognition motif-containing protein
VHFSQFGRVTEIDLKRDKETNRMTGFGFVTFEDEAEADNACKNYYQTLLGKKVEVKLAEPRNRSPGEVHRQQQFIYSDHHLISTGYGGSQDSGRGSGYPQQYPYSSGGGE